MTLFYVIGATAFGLIFMVFLHYRSKKVQSSKLVETLANASGFLSFVLTAYVVVSTLDQSPPLVAGHFIEVTCTAFPSEAAGASEAKRKWLTQQSAAINCRAELATTIKSELKLQVEQSHGEMAAQDIKIKVNVALQLSEIVEGQFLPDGSYQLTMRVPRPVV